MLAPPLLVPGFPQPDLSALLPGAGALQAAIFNSSTFASIATDTHGVIRIINVGAQRLLGYTAIEAVNRLTAVGLAEPHEMAARAEALSAELGVSIDSGFEALSHKAARGIEDTFELTWIRCDQSRFPARGSVTALRNPEGGIIGYLLIVNDNTVNHEIEAARSGFEQALRNHNVQLEQASRIKSEFLANMSHELRTPLNAIIGFSEVLRDGLLGDLPERQRACVNDIFASGQHLLDLINDILDLSKVEAGKMTLDLEAVPIASLFVNSLTIVREKAAERGVRLHIDLEEQLGSIEVDARKIKQILYNLLSNAVKFTPEGGQVTLCVRRVSRDDVGQLAGPWPGRTLPSADARFPEFLRITVTDSGIGMPEASLDQLFTPFSQIDSGLARRFEGTGLGLAMIKVLADLHGGAAAVESAVDEGSRFTVWLPFREAGVSGPAEPRPPLVGLLPGLRMALVVEDDFKAAGLIRVQLEAEGFQVLHASSAEAALRMALQQPLALITLDLMLPGMDGWEFLERVKKIPGLHHIPVVIISIMAERGRGIALGAASVLQKPVSRQDLYEALVELDLFPLSGRKGLKVLIADDDPKAVELVATRFAGLASTILRASGGREAIALTRAEQPDLIVLDLLMPEVTGFDVVEALKDDPQTAGIPILVVTARTVSFEEREKLNSHVMAILDKADFSHRFIAEVHRAVASRRVKV